MFFSLLHHWPRSRFGMLATILFLSDCRRKMCMPLLLGNHNTTWKVTMTRNSSNLWCASVSLFQLFFILQLRLLSWVDLEEYVTSISNELQASLSAQHIILRMCDSLHVTLGILLFQVVLTPPPSRFECSYHQNPKERK